MRASNKTDLSSRDFSSGLHPGATAATSRREPRYRVCADAAALDKEIELLMGRCARTCVSDSPQGSVEAPQVSQWQS